MGFAAKALFKYGLKRGWWASSNRPGDAADVWYMGGAIVASATGLPINSDMAMRSGAVFSCVSIISKSMGMLPLGMRKFLPDGESSEPAPDHPLHDVINRKPNSWQSRFEFMQMMQAHLCLRGNAYAHIIPGRRGAVDALEPMHPDRVRPLRLENGGIGYDVTTPQGMKRLLQEEVFHVRWLALDGIRGVSPIDYMREPIGISLAAQEYAARFFSNNATPGGVLRHPKGLSDPARTNMKKSWMEMQSGLQNAHTIAILEEGVEYQPISMTNEQAQFLESRKFSVDDIARIFNVPPHMIASLDRATFNNIEHQSLEFVKYTLAPWVCCWEQAISRDLIIMPDKYLAQFDMDAMARGDFKSRMDGYAIAINNRIMTPNEVRRKEGLPPDSDGGDDFYQMVNVAPSDGGGDQPMEEQPPTSPAVPPPSPPSRNRRRKQENTLMTPKKSFSQELAEALGHRNGNGNGRHEHASH